MKVGSLFAGIGGFDLGLERAGMEVAWQVEINEWSRRVLAKHWPNVPQYEDIYNVGKHNLGPVDLICGGFPCQPFSSAGKRRGKDDDRYLWPQMLRVIKEVGPSWVIGENVAGLISMGLDQCLSDLENSGYSCEAFIIPACAINAPHRRDRVWIVANSSGDNGKLSANIRSSTAQTEDWERDNVYTHLHFEDWQQIMPPGSSGDGNGVSRGVDRLKGLGNAVVPQIPEIIGRAIMEIEDEGL